MIGYRENKASGRLYAIYESDNDKNLSQNPRSLRHADAEGGGPVD